MGERPRGTRSGAGRVDVDVLRRRVAFLEGDDRVLATAVLEYGLSVAAVARLTGTSRSALSRRLGRIVARLADDTYSRCSAPTSGFSPRELEILRAHLLGGKSAKEITRQRAVSYYRVLRTIRRARRLVGPPASVLGSPALRGGVESCGRRGGGL